MWYSSHAPEFGTAGAGNAALREFFYVFSSSGIDIKTQSQSERLELLKQKIKAELDYTAKNYPPRCYTFASCCNRLNSILGFGLIEARDIFNEAASELGLQHSKNCVYFKDIT